MRRKSGFIKKLKKNRIGFCIWPIKILYEIILIFNLKFDGADDLCECCCDLGECCSGCSSSSQKKSSGCCDCCCECL
ncbi:MAG: hypothetical protein GPJ52_10725 [Candidatus Heimdallarchaeota archaeon]|nr:hypothetical protein [Candidatus Heimdallarchaeota archaeon]